MWHRRTWAIDHGAALYVHHAWPSRPPDPQRFATMPFDASTHVLRDVAGDPSAAHETLAARLDDGALEEILASVPDDWLEPTLDLPDPPAARTAYLDLLRARLQRPKAWVPGGRA